MDALINYTTAGRGRSCAMTYERGPSGMTAHNDIKEALVRTLVDAASSQNDILDPEDREMLVKYHMGQITMAELDQFALAKAKRIEEQEKRPQ